MKKSVILTIIVIYVAAFFVIGFIGEALKVYNATVFAEGIICENENYVAGKLEEYKNLDYDGYIKFVPTTKPGADKPFEVLVKCRVTPDTATFSDLTYNVPSKSNISYEIVEGNCKLKFKKGDYIIVEVSQDYGSILNHKILVIVDHIDTEDIF